MRNTSHIVSRSAEETLRIGAELGERLQPGDALLLTGDLGAGKTTLTQGIAAGPRRRGTAPQPDVRHGDRVPRSAAPLSPGPLPRR